MSFSFPKLPTGNPLTLPKLPTTKSLKLPKVPVGNPLTALQNATDPAASTKSSFTKFIQDGITIPWLGLFILAGGIPYPPFSYLGLGGVNLLVVGSTMWFAMKAGLQFGITLANTFITAYYPELWWLSTLLSFNFWYLFDLLQMFSPAFHYEGFKVPFTTFDPNKPLHTKLYDTEDGNKTYAKGAIGPTSILVIGGLTCIGTYSLLNYLPPVVTAAWKPIVNTIFTVVGGVTALAGGGIGGMLVLPKLMSSLKSNVAEVSSALPPAAPTVQTGGAIPSLEVIANKILNGEETMNNQEGGGSDDTATNVFLGTLTVVTLGGIGLALIRSKGESVNRI